jgi:S1-C subfamily serine protease
MTEAVRAALPELSAQLASLVENIAPSIVEVQSQERTAGSGFVWRPGLVVTADEAVSDGGELAIRLDGQPVPAKLTGRDPSTGIALLRVDGLNAPAVSLAVGHAAKAGEIVLAVGRREYGISARLGIVSLAAGPWRSMRGGHIDSRMRLDLTLDRRGEGAAVIESEGHVLGMALRGPRRSVLAIPAATIERIASRILANGSVRPGYLGLGLHPVQMKKAEGGVGFGLIVLGVAPGGPGEAAGILQGDVITAWNGEPVHGLRGLFRKLGPDSVGQTVELSLMRAGQGAPVKVVIGARPEV